MKGLTYLLIFFLFLLLFSCVKEDAKIPSTNASSDGTGNTTGTSGGGGGGTTVTDPIEDPLAVEAWHLENTGQSAYSTGSGTAGEDINIKEAHDLGARGSGVRIAVSDTGVDIYHADLQDNELPSEHRNYIFNLPVQWAGSNPYPSHGNAHGTAVAGLIAALGWNGIGSRGVAPEAKFAAFSYIIDYSAAVTNSSLLLRDIDQTDGDFDIFNYSYGYNECEFYEEDPLINEAIEEGVQNLRDGKGALYVQSAGNSYIDTLSNCLGDLTPGSYTGNTNMTSDRVTPYKILVGALDADGVKASYSTAGSGLWVSAPGGENGTTLPAMITTDISGCSRGYSYLSILLDVFNGGRLSENVFCDYTSRMNGTSSSAPIASGVIALLLEANPLLSWRDVKHILAITAEQVDLLPATVAHPLGAAFEMAGYVYDYRWITNTANFNFSNLYGFGRINALTAIQLAEAYTFPLGPYEKTVNPNSEVWYYDSGNLSVPIPDMNNVGVSHSLDVKHNFFIEAVQVEFTSDHTRPSDIAIHLISPGGTESRLLTINNGNASSEFPSNKLLLSNAFYGEESLGMWTLKLYDANAAETGSLTNWKILIHGHKIDGDGSLPNPVTNLSLNYVWNASKISPLFTFTGSTSSDVARYEVSVGTTPGGTEESDWVSIGMLTTSYLDHLSMSDLTLYYLNVRAVDERENVSSVSTASFFVEFL